MSTIAEKTEIELSDKYYEDKCLLGDVWDRDRSHACQILAMKCNDELNKIDDIEKEKVRQKIVNEAGFNQYESPDDIVEVEGGDPFKIWARTYSIFEETYDSDKYIDKLKRDKKFGKCSIALYGVETQFWKQVSEGLFQNQDNATALKNIEGLIFDNRTSYTLNPRDIRDIEVDKWLYNIRTAPYEKRGELIDKKTSYFNDIFGEEEGKIKTKYRDASYFIPQEIEKIYDYLILSNEINKADYAIQAKNANTVLRLCNNVHNPYVTDGNYRFCSSAYNNGKGQTFEIYKQIEPTEATKSLYTLPEYVFETTSRLADLIKGRDYNKRLLNKWKEELKKYDKDNYYYTYWKDRIIDTEKTQKDIYKKIEELKKEKLKLQWKETAILGCWHNFYDLIPKEYYPEYIRGKYQEVEFAVSLGEITEEQATKLIKNIGELEKEFTDTLKLHKPISYQPTRMRLYGSQIAIHSLINDNLCRVPLDDVFVDEITKTNVRKGFIGINLRQLLEHRIYSQEEVDEMIASLKELDVNDILENFTETKMAEQATGESLLEYVHDDFSIAFSHNIGSDEEDALEMMFVNVSEFTSHDMIKYAYSATDENLNTEEAEREGKKPIVLWSDDKNNELELEIEETDTWSAYSAEAYPAIPLDMILTKFRELEQQYIYINPSVSMYAWVDYYDLVEAGDEAIGMLNEDYNDEILDSLIRYYRGNKLPRNVDSIKQFYEKTIDNACRNVPACREVAVTNSDKISRIKEYINEKAHEVDLDDEHLNISDNPDTYLRDYFSDTYTFMLNQLKNLLL